MIYSSVKVSAIFAEYAGILASEGETETALKYIKGQGHNGAVLQDRSDHHHNAAVGKIAATRQRRRYF